MTVRTLTVREHVRSYPSNAVKAAKTEQLRREVEQFLAERAYAQTILAVFQMSQDDLLGGDDAA